MTPRLQWRAASDGIGHAVTKPAAFNAVCGRRAVLERLSHPVQTKCLACRRALGENVEAPAA